MAIAQQHSDSLKVDKENAFDLSFFEWLQSLEWPKFLEWAEKTEYNYPTMPSVYTDGHVVKDGMTFQELKSEGYKEAYKPCYPNSLAKVLHPQEIKELYEYFEASDLNFEERIRICLGVYQSYDMPK